MWKIERFLYSNTNGPRCCIGNNIIATFKTFEEANHTFKQMNKQHEHDDTVWLRLLHSPEEGK